MTNTELVVLVGVLTIGLVALEGPVVLLNLALWGLVIAGVLGFNNWLGRKRR